MATTGAAGAAAAGGGERAARLPGLDIARGLAIVAMVIYHGAFDLSAARLIPVYVPGDLGWTILARLTAGSFLAIVGIALVLATRRGLRWPPFLRRVALIAAGAALVSVSTWLIEPGAWVFFGILHLIALSSLLALPFLRLPTALVALTAAAFLALPWLWRSAVFNAPALVWLGLYTEPPTSVDFTPVFPWFGVVLGGVVAGRLLVAYGGALWRWRPEGAMARGLTWAGRWSLAIYLVHQPVLYGLTALAAMVVPADNPAAKANMISECASRCEPGDPDCPARCGCMVEGLWGTDLLAVASVDAMTPDQATRFDGIVQACNTPPPESAPQD